MREAKFSADTCHNIKDFIYIDAIYILYHLIIFYTCNIYIYIYLFIHLVIYTYGKSDVFVVSLI